MSGHQVDTLILGSGFGGTLLGLMLAERGQSVAIVDQSRHPRFAIGESSTPLADQLLMQIATEYDLDDLKPLCAYGSWKANYPQLTCGAKSGFSYFGHGVDPGEVPSTAPLQQMLVAARTSLAGSDTHWLRSDIDAFLCAKAKDVCAVFEDANYQISQLANGWAIDGQSNGKSFHVTSGFVVDATGRNSTLATVLNMADESHRLKTQSSCEYAHFSGVQPNSKLLSDIGSHPFDADLAAVHHVLRDGWMWQLRFDDGTTSVGFCQSGSKRRSLMDVIEFNDYLKRQFRSSRIVRPEAGPQSLDRLSYLRAKAAGKNWAALPSATGFVDPLHSTGIAHTLFRLKRLAEILTTPTQHRRECLDEYNRQLIAEILHIDRMIEGCYASLPSFRLWCLWCMVYFAAITSVESGRNSSSFLLADDAPFSTMLRQARCSLGEAIALGNAEAADEFESRLKQLIAPWNRVGLLDSADRMYVSTAAPEQ